MDNQHRNEWYGPEATMFKKCDGYNLINYQCEGTGTCLDYSLFPGIDLIFMDFNCSDGLQLFGYIPGANGEPGHSGYSPLPAGASGV